MVDIFEAGPVVQSRRTEIRAIRESQSLPVVAIAPTPIDSEPCIVASKAGGFRAAVGAVALREEGVMIQPDLAAALGVSTGASVRFAALKPRRQASAPYPDANIAFD